MKRQKGRCRFLNQLINKLRSSPIKATIIALISILSVGLLVPLAVEANPISYSDTASTELPTLRSDFNYE